MAVLMLFGCPSDPAIPGVESSSSGDSSTTDPTFGCTEVVPTSGAEILESTEPGLTGGAERGCVEPTHVDGCCCFDTGLNGVRNVCPKAYLCPEILMLCDSEGPIGDCPPEHLTATCDAAIDCALAALAQRKIGGVRWAIVEGYSDERVELFMTGDGYAYIAGNLSIDLFTLFYSVERLGLESDAYYSECAAKPSAVDRFECVRRVQKAGMSVEMCTEEFTPMP